LFWPHFDRLIWPPSLRQTVDGLKQPHRGDFPLSVRSNARAERAIPLKQESRAGSCCLILAIVLAVLLDRRLLRDAYQQLSYSSADPLRRDFRSSFTSSRKPQFRLILGRHHRSIENGKKDAHSPALRSAVLSSLTTHNCTTGASTGLRRRHHCPDAPSFAFS